MLPWVLSQRQYMGLALTLAKLGAVMGPLPLFAAITCPAIVGPAIVSPVIVSLVVSTLGLSAHGGFVNSSTQV
ncbi:MAG: hypothetical protein AAFR42_16305 [Cyanobacteria bacterium J06628_6]